MSAISFYSEQVAFSLANERQITDWFKESCKQENRSLGEVSVIFCSDEYLLKMNLDHLQHDYYTDIITFDYSSGPDVSGDIFISIDRVAENATSFKTDFIDELHRVMIHGVLHLIGYKDSEAKDKSEMSSKEDYYLSLRPFKKN
jgi:probable rRNA maturation factor